MAMLDFNEEWLGHVQPVGLVVAPVVLARHGLNPETQTRADTEEVGKLLSSMDDGASSKNGDTSALNDPWAFFENILGWRAALVAGAPGGSPVPEELSLRVEESDTEIAPHWAVVEPDGGWQILARIEGTGVNPDERGAIEGWEASPHQRLERLLREKEVPIGLLITDEELRFVYAPRGETSGWMCFPLRSLGAVGGRPMLGGLKLLLSSFRLYNDAPNRRLPALLKASRDAQAEVSTKLASQVLGALHELLRGLHAADDKRIEALAASRQEHLYDGLLTVLLRLVFLLYAEDRDLIPSRTDAAARAFYDQGYGVRTLYARLLDDKAHYPDTIDERRGAWSRLLALFRLVHQGDSSRSWIRGRGGKLFDTAEFPFLQGQDAETDLPSPAAVSDGCILRILNLLLNLGGEKLSYRTLDVEQIGSVYETVMGFTIETRPGPALAIRAGKGDRTPVFVDISALAMKKGSDRAKFLKEEAGRKVLSDKLGKTLSSATDVTAIIEALRPIVDERGSPGGAPSAPGSPLLQPTDERRRSGSHYTPRSLTAPIVQYALEPAFARLGPDGRPEELLALTVCDPAMGSGAFLVEACRALGERLVKAWERWPETRPKIPEDEDEQLHARRLVAQRCLYGVDKNPRAVDLAKLSLWLATLARDHEFTFLDHSLKCGDSLVGLTSAQIAAANWDDSKPSLPLFRQMVRDSLTRAMQGRAEIQNAPDDTMRAIQEARHRSLESEVSPIRTMGDAVVSAFFAADKSKAREKARASVESQISGMPPRWDLLELAAARLRQGKHGITPFHWRVEFPEVFVRENGGFDAIIGNPPFLGGARISSELGIPYFNYLTKQFSGCQHQCDLVGYFFRRAFSLLRNEGSFGLIATNTISQGDTREGALLHILSNGGSIARAVKRFYWPGEATIIVSVVHVWKQIVPSAPTLDGVIVSRVNAFLLEGKSDVSPAALASAPYFSKGSQIYGQGFVFDDNDPNASPTSVAEALKELPENRERIFPYIGGSEINNSPRQEHHRQVIQFSDLQKERELDGWPTLRDLVRKKVLPGRLKLGDNPNNIPLKRRWWAYQAHRPELYRRLASLSQVLCIPRVTTHANFVFCSPNQIFSDQVVLIATESFEVFSILQSRVHELFARLFSSTLGDGLRYGAADCLRTFPLPALVATGPLLEAIGTTYHDFRAQVMMARSEGLTKIYNRFHAREENSPDIVRLRAIHHEMDVAVLRAYARAEIDESVVRAWEDLANRASAEFIALDADEGRMPKTRFDWPTEFKDEVLARLLDLNAERKAEESAKGVTTITSEEDEEIEEVQG